MSEGTWTSGSVRPILWGGVLAVFSEGGPKSTLYLVAGEKTLQIAEHPEVSVLAFDPGRLVVFERSATGHSGPGRVIAYSVTRQ